MASYTISNTNTSVTFNVSGLSSGDKVRFYVRYEPDSGGSIVDQTLTASGSTMSRTFSVSAGRSYAVNVSVNSGGWIGAKYFSTGSDRPSNWSWSSTISKGNKMRITATDWNNFCSRINAFRAYKGLSNYSFTAAVSGRSMTAAQGNQARSAINEISGHGSLPSSAVRGSTVTASFFNGLKDALNAIS